jgi:hypothetical protein
MHRFRRRMIALIVTLVLWLQGCLFDWAVAAEGYLRVVYTPPTLTVEAQDVTLQEVLREIGLQAGFTVVDADVPRMRLHVSFTDLTLQEGLRQLLKGENYVLISRKQRREQAAVGTGIEKIVLLGSISSPAVSPESGSSGKARASQGSDTRQSPEPLPSSHSAALSTAAMPSFPDKWGRKHNGRPGQPDSAASLEELLTTHAFAIPQKWLQDRAAEVDSTPIPSLLKRHVDTPSADVGGGTSPSTSPEINEALAITTQMAQRNLKGLLDSLTVATESLRNSLEQQRQ